MKSSKEKLEDPKVKVELRASVNESSKRQSLTVPPALDKLSEEKKEPSSETLEVSQGSGVAEQPKAVDPIKANKKDFFEASPPDATAEKPSIGDPK
mmetsp:Transcript_3489/g.5228  ORF Transcript_3489/g.5228 Transcript_3489/m.5228 type:complete len:96 (+) Transcript_3489:352-639(+)